MGFHVLRQVAHGKRAQEETAEHDGSAGHGVDGISSPVAVGRTSSGCRLAGVGKARTCAAGYRIVGQQADTLPLQSAPEKIGEETASAVIRHCRRAVQNVFASMARSRCSGDFGEVKFQQEAAVVNAWKVVNPGDTRALKRRKIRCRRRLPDERRRAFRRL